MGKVIIITGHYGAGKTNFAVNTALDIRNRKPDAKITVCDLDIVNPYFRSADFFDTFAMNKIRTAAPKFANSNLDIPALDFDMKAEIANSDYLIIDVGGDESGAVALGRYADILRHASGFSMLYVINCHRCLTSEPEEAVSIMHEIEKASRLKHTAIVNNSNLGSQTDTDILEHSVKFADEVCKQTGLPLCCTSAMQGIRADVPRHFPCKIFVKTVWER
jgi:hypothetical protein